MAVQEVQDASYIIADLNNRVRVLESKYSLLGERLLLVNQNMIEEYKKLLREISAMNAEMGDLRAELAEMGSGMRKVVGELDLFARKESVKVLDKYLKLWSPLNTVSEDQVERIVEEKIKKEMAKHKK